MLEHALTSVANQNLQNKTRKTSGVACKLKLTSTTKTYLAEGIEYANPEPRDRTGATNYRKWPENARWVCEYCRLICDSIKGYVAHLNVAHKQGMLAGCYFIHMLTHTHSLMHTHKLMYVRTHIHAHTCIRTSIVHAYIHTYILINIHMYIYLADAILYVRRYMYLLSALAVDCVEGECCCRFCRKKLANKAIVGMHRCKQRNRCTVCKKQFRTPQKLRVRSFNLLSLSYHSITHIPVLTSVGG